MKNKSLVVITAALLLGMTLAACKSIENQSSTTGDPSGSAGSQAGTSLSQANMLIVGTLKLEGTDQAVTAEEAAQLLTLWQAYRSLSNTQTAAEAEVDGLLKQIESTMTSDQAQAIQAMKLTATDMASLIQSMGGLRHQGTPNPQSTPGANFRGGNFQSGNFPGGMQPPDSSGGGTTGSRPSGGGPLIIQGGPGMGGDVGSVAGVGGGPVLQGTPDPSMQATAQARFSTQASQVNTLLLNALINKLEAMTTK